MHTIDLGPYVDDPGYEAARHLDSTDPLAEFSTRFAPTDPGLIYLDGNSLGRPPVAAASRIARVVEHEWASRLIRSWPERWWQQADRIGDSLAELIGASPDEVIVADSTSVALFKLTLGALQARSGRTRVVTDDVNFPTDNYITAAAAQLAGCDITTVPSPDGIEGPVDGLIAALDESTALLTLSHVLFKSGYLYDMERLTRAAHEVGALVLWDLSHSVGAVPINLNTAGADLAVGCTYKYLNGGPGAPAFLYVNRRVDAEIVNPLTGWWGHENPFAFDLIYRPADTIRRFQTGTMPILSLTGVETGVAITREAGMPAIREKSIALSTYFIEHAERILGPHGFRLASPRDPGFRGSHVSLRHKDGWLVAQAMVEEGKVIPDFRQPDNIRFGFAPLYTSFGDVHTAISRVARLVTDGRHNSYSPAPSTVT